MDTFFTDQEYASEQDARRAVIAAGYIRSHVEIYKIGHRFIRWKFRLSEDGLADEAASNAESLPRKRLADHVKRVERRRLNL